MNEYGDTVRDGSDECGCCQEVPTDKGLPSSPRIEVCLFSTVRADGEKTECECPNFRCSVRAVTPTTTDGYMVLAINRKDKRASRRLACSLCGKYASTPVHAGFVLDGVVRCRECCTDEGSAALPTQPHAPAHTDVRPTRTGNTRVTRRTR